MTLKLKKSSAKFKRLMSSSALKYGSKSLRNFNSYLGSDEDVDESPSILGENGEDGFIPKSFTIPCLDRNLIYQMRLKLDLSVMEHYERHCPLKPHAADICKALPSFTSPEHKYLLQLFIQSVSTNLPKITNNCKLLDWVGTAELVAEGCLMPNRPRSPCTHGPRPCPQPRPPSSLVLAPSAGPQG